MSTKTTNENLVNSSNQTHSEILIYSIFSAIQKYERMILKERQKTGILNSKKTQGLTKQ